MRTSKNRGVRRYSFRLLRDYRLIWLSLSENIVPRSFRGMRHRALKEFGGPKLLQRQDPQDRSDQQNEDVERDVCARRRLPDLMGFYKVDWKQQQRVVYGTVSDGVDKQLVRLFWRARNEKLVCLDAYEPGMTKAMNRNSLSASQISISGSPLRPEQRRDEREVS